MHRTNHFEVRCQQRGIPPLIQNWLIEFGVEYHDHHGGIVLTFTRDSRRKLERSVGREPVRRMSEWLNSYAVISTSGSLITAGKRTRRIKN